MPKKTQLDKNYRSSKKQQDNTEVNGKFIIYLEYTLLAAISVYVLLLTTFKTWSDDDIFWHLSTGRYIVEHTSVPSSDVFGFVTKGDQWIPFEWGWDVLTFLIYKLSGFVGLSIFRSLVFLFIVFLIYRILKLFKVSTPVVFLFLAWFPISILGRLTVRPHIISYLFITILLFILIRFRYFKRTEYKYLYILPAVFLVWANFHMGVLLGLLIFAIYIISEALGYKFPKRFSAGEVKPFSANDLKRLLYVFLISLVCIFINPHTYNTYIYAYSHTQMKMLQEIIEWESPFSADLAGDFDLSIYKYYLFASVLIFYFALKKKDIFPFVLVMVFLIYSLNAVRYTTDYKITISIFLFLALDYLITRIRSKKFIYFLNKSPAPRIIVLAVIIFIAINIPNDKIYSNYLKYPRVYGTGIDDDIMPMQVFDFIKANNINRIGKFPFNHIGIGGIFSWYFPDQYNFIDTRNLNDKIFEEYDRIDNKISGFEDRLKELNIDYVIYYLPGLTVTPQIMNQIVVSYLSVSDDWKLIFWDDKSFLFVKNLPQFQDIINRFEYKYITPYNYYMRRNVINNSFRDDKETAANEIARNLKEESRGVLINNIAKYYRSVIKN